MHSPNRLAVRPPALGQTQSYSVQPCLLLAPTISLAELSRKKKTKSPESPKKLSASRFPLPSPTLKWQVIAPLQPVRKDIQQAAGAKRAETDEPRDGEAGRREQDAPALDCRGWAPEGGCRQRRPAQQGRNPRGKGNPEDTPQGIVGVGPKRLGNGNPSRPGVHHKGGMVVVSDRTEKSTLAKLLGMDATVEVMPQEQLAKIVGQNTHKGRRQNPSRGGR